MAQKSTNPAQQFNFVAQDQIWKYHIETELEAAKKWFIKWGFLTTPFEELIKDEKKEPTKPMIELPEHLQIRPVTPVEKYIKDTESQMGDELGVLQLPMGEEVYPSPPVPKTTQGFIGWRSSVPGLELERYYQIRSCKGAFHKDLKWPDEPSD